jgi:hypothetical protein
MFAPALKLSLGKPYHATGLLKRILIRASAGGSQKGVEIRRIRFSTFGDLKALDRESRGNSYWWNC